MNFILPVNLMESLISSFQFPDKKLFVLMFAFMTVAASAQSSDVDTTGFTPAKSPLGALLRSAVLPGLGQYYNESYWKIPIIAGVGAWFVYNYADNNHKYQDYLALYRDTGNRIYYINREFYRDQRDLFAIYLGILYVANLLDAYVDAHLFDFNVQEDFFRNRADFQLTMKFSF